MARCRLLMKPQHPATCWLPGRERAADTSQRSRERPFIDAEVVLRLADAIEDRYRVLVLLAGFGGLRLGELIALRRRDIDLQASTVRVERQTVELRRGERIETPPKTDAGTRTVLYTAWDRVRTATGLTQVHPHDLRHAAGTLAAQTGATTRELMARLGHASPAAAQRYQHAAERRDTTIAFEDVMRVTRGTTGDPTQGELWAKCGFRPIQSHTRRG